MNSGYESLKWVKGGAEESTMFDSRRRDKWEVGGLWHKHSIQKIALKRNEENVNGSSI